LTDHPIKPNSDYYPILDLNASRTRYLGTNALEMVDWIYQPLPFFDMLSGTAPQDGRTEVSREPIFPKTQLYRTAMVLRDFFVEGRTLPDSGDVPPAVVLKARDLLGRIGDCGSPDLNERLFALIETAIRVIPYVTPSEARGILERVSSAYCVDPTAEEKQWLGVFAAVGNRDGTALAQKAEALMKLKSEASDQYLGFLTTAAMLGLLSENRKAEASAIWAGYRERLPQAQRANLVFKILAAHAQSQ